MKTIKTPSIDNAITARINLAAIKANKRTRAQLGAHLCLYFKIAEFLMSLSDAQVYEICKRPAKEAKP